MVHRANCVNIKAILRHPDKYFHLNWSEDTRGHFQVQLHVVTKNQPGVLATVSNNIAEHNSNINNVSVDQHHRDFSDMTFVIEVTDRNHLANIIRQIHAESTVARVNRQ